MWCRGIAAPSQKWGQDEQKVRQRYRETERQTERKTERQKDRKTDNWKMENEGAEMFEKLSESGLKTGFLTDREIF